MNLEQYASVWFSLVLLVAFWVRSLWQPQGNYAFDAPIMGSKWSWIARVKYMFNAMGPLKEGYDKVLSNPNSFT